MFASVLTALVSGMDIIPIRVEADVSDGLPSFTMVGFPSVQVKEAQERVRTALRNSGISLPAKKIIVNLAPADIRKEGASFDLPVAIAILAASDVLPASCLSQVMFMGELSLSGHITASTGVLPRVLKARDLGCRYCLLPEANLAEASLVPQMPVIATRTLNEAIACLCAPEGHFTQGSPLPSNPAPPIPDFAEIHGQESAKRAAEIAASGFHNLLMIGPPGGGKTMIARRIPGILPRLTFEECLELTRIYSIAGLLSQEQPLITQRPFRSPHHSTSAHALAGGGKVPTPGEVTLSEKGVLFLDELAEFSRTALEALRQPLEDRVITISRVSGTSVFPANFMLVAATNPCPCGYHPDRLRCICSHNQVSHYLGKISQPLLDRIDLCVKVSGVSLPDLSDSPPGESSASIRKRVYAAQKLQQERYRGEHILFNGELTGSMTETYCQMTGAARQTIGLAFEKITFSARTYHRILKTARTIADLDQSEKICENHISEAICYRSFDKRLWNP